MGLTGPTGKQGNFVDAVSPQVQLEIPSQKIVEGNTRYGLIASQTGARLRILTVQAQGKPGGVATHLHHEGVLEFDDHDVGEVAGNSGISPS